MSYLHIPCSIVAIVVLSLSGCGAPQATSADVKAGGGDTKANAPNATASAADAKERAIAPSGDYDQWGSTPAKNNVRTATNIPTDFNVGKVDRKTGKRVPGTTKNIKWTASLGSQTYGNPAVTQGKILIGTNNGNGYVKRYPGGADGWDLGVLLCLNEADGKFLWQFSAEKLHTGRAQDWEGLGLCSTPIVDGDRAWFVDNRCRVVCVDLAGFYDNEDDGPIKAEWARMAQITRSEDPAEDKVQSALEELKKGKLPAVLQEELAKADVKVPAETAVTPDSTSKLPSTAWNFTDNKRSFQVRVEGPRLSVFRQMTPDDKEEADVIWILDMIKDLGVSPHNASSSSGVIAGDVLFMCTSNGVDGQHNNISAPKAASFIAIDKATGNVLWSDNSPDEFILHGQWSSPAYGVLGGVPQVIFGGGDGYVYSFRGEKTADAKPELLWKFDCNPKESFYEILGRGTRNHIIGTPVIYDGRVYVAVGEDPEHGDGDGHLWCIDPTKRGDVSPQLAVMRDDPKKPAPRNRLQAVDKARGEIAIPNPNSAVVWHYDKQDVNGDGMIDDMQETMHRTIGSVVIADDILYIADFSGVFHCLDAKSGKVLWTHDFLAACWGSPLIADGKVFIGDEDGDFYIFKHSKEKQLITAKKDNPDDTQINCGSSVYGTPIVANNVLYVFSRNTLFAITPEGPSASVGK